MGQYPKLIVKLAFNGSNPPQTWMKVAQHTREVSLPEARSDRLRGGG
jgi:hypothetical protein